MKKGLVLTSDGTACVACPENWTSIGAGLCVQDQGRCKEGYVPTMGGLGCMPCGKGWYQSDPQTCSVCNTGTYQFESGATLCYQCPQGQASNSMGATQCLSCAPGYYAPAAGMSACQFCNAVVMTQGSECKTPSCPNYFFYSLDTNHCERCTICLDTTYAAQRCSAMNDTVCQACTSTCPAFSALTKYCTLYQDSICTVNALCPLGTFFSGICVGCPAGTYNDVPGATSCSKCLSGFPSAGRDACTNGPCDPGSYQKLLPDGGYYCELCMPGTGGCRPCPENTYAARWGQAECGACPDGMYALRGSSACAKDEICTVA